MARPKANLADARRPRALEAAAWRLAKGEEPKIGTLTKHVQAFGVGLLALSGRAWADEHGGEGAAQLNSQATRKGGGACLCRLVGRPPIQWRSVDSLTLLALARESVDESVDARTTPGGEKTSVYGYGYGVRILHSLPVSPSTYCQSRASGGAWSDCAFVIVVDTHNHHIRDRRHRRGPRRAGRRIPS